MKSNIPHQLIERRTVSLNGNKDIVLFLGTERGLAVLQEIIRHKIARVIAVCVQDSKGHGSEATSQIEDFAKDAGSEVFASSNLPPDQYAEFLTGYIPAVALCINWRRLCPPDAINAPVRGLLVAHDSLLPHLRGFAPLNHSIRNGEDKTGVTLFYADEDTDSGDIVGQMETYVGLHEYVATIRERVTALTVDLISKYLPIVLDGKAPGMPQDESKATYGVRLTPEDGEINFNKRSRDIYNLIRATSDPYPGAFGYLNAQKTECIRIWTASLPDDSPKVSGAIAGRVVDWIPNKGTFVCTGDGTILLQEVEIEGERTTADKVLYRYAKTIY